MLCVLNKPGYQDIYDMIKVLEGAIGPQSIHRPDRHANVMLAILMESQLCTYLLVQFSESNGKERERNFGLVLEQSDWLILVLGPLN